MEQLLKEIYEDVKEWLKYAETKNAGLLTFNGVLLFGVINFIKEFKPTGTLFCILVIICFLILISIFLLLWSFVPRLRIPRLFYINKVSKHTAGVNLHFYGEIYGYSPKAYLNSLNQKYYNGTCEWDKKEIDLSTQIIRLSQICMKKYSLFNYSLKFTLSSIIILGLGFLTELFQN